MGELHQRRGRRMGEELLGERAALPRVDVVAIPQRSVADAQHVLATGQDVADEIVDAAHARLGDPLDVALKLAVAARVIPLLTGEMTYLDVAVPERPVAGTLNSQVELER